MPGSRRSSTTRSYRPPDASRSPSMPSSTRSAWKWCSSSPRFTYWPTVRSSSMTRIFMRGTGRYTRKVAPRPGRAVHLDPAAVVGHDAVADREARARCPAPAAWWCRTARRSWSGRRAGCPTPVSSTSTTTSSARAGLRPVRTVSCPPCSIASSALSISAMSTWMSCSALPGVSGRLGASARTTCSCLNRWWCLSRNSVSSTSALSDTGRLARRLRPAEVEQAVHDPAAALHLAVDDLQVFRRPAAASRGPASASRPSIAATQALMVASGLLISCMTPAASCPMAASFSLCRIWPCTRCHSVTSSPMVMTWVISSPSSRMGILLSRK